MSRESVRAFQVALGRNKASGRDHYPHCQIGRAWNEHDGALEYGGPWTMCATSLEGGS